MKKEERREFLTSGNGRLSIMRWSHYIGTIMASIVVACCVPAMFYAIHLGRGENVVQAAFLTAFGLFTAGTAGKAIQRRFESPDSKGSDNGK